MKPYPVTGFIGTTSIQLDGRVIISKKHVAFDALNGPLKIGDIIEPTDEEGVHHYIRKGDFL